MIELLKRRAPDSVTEEDDENASINTSEAPCASPFAPLTGATSNATSPILRRRQSECRNISARDSGPPSVMSLLSTLARANIHPGTCRNGLISRNIWSTRVYALFVNTRKCRLCALNLPNHRTDAECPRAQVLALQFLMRL